MLLTLAIKKHYVLKVPEQIVPKYTSIDFKQDIDYLIHDISVRENQQYTCIMWEKDFIRVSKYGSSFNAFKMTPNDPKFKAFKQVLDKKANQEADAKYIINWVSTGIAMCYTTECIEQIYPQFLLDAFTEVARKVQLSSKFTETPTNNPKFLAFKQKNEGLVGDIKHAMLLDIIAPGRMNE